MKQIVILGGSAAGVKMTEEIRRHDPSSGITIIAFDGHYPYNRDAFASFISKDIAPESVFCRPKDFYIQHNIKIVFDQKIARINFKRKKIFTEEKQQIDYDILVVTDTPENRYPDIKGTDKENVYGYKKLKDIDKIVNALPVIKTVVIQSDSFSGLQAALSFIKRDKEVILVCSPNNFIARHFEAEAAQWLTEKFVEKGLRIIPGNMITEILGDKDAKAVRLQSGKVFSAEAIVFMETDEDLRLFSESIRIMNRKIEVNHEFRADAEGVFAVDQACSLSGSEPVTPLSVLEEQAEIVAAVINGQERAFSMPLCAWSQKMEGLVLTVLGNVDEEGITEDHIFDRASATYKRLYLKENRLIGAILVNKEEERVVLLENIRQKSCYDLGTEQQGVNSVEGKECCVSEMNGEKFQ
ncbi:MAG: FAD-dependent oxidoreductase [Candidatus Omnitrophica bacterium]|nr:FAD-dependent oxidoreductase [Candidatus Omnitrophota bacterium]